MPADGDYDPGGPDVSPSTLLTGPLVHGNTQVSIWMLCIHERTIGKDDEEGTVTMNYNILQPMGTHGERACAPFAGVASMLICTLNFSLQSYRFTCSCTPCTVCALA